MCPALSHLSEAAPSAGTSPSYTGHRSAGPVRAGETWDRLTTTPEGHQKDPAICLFLSCVPFLFTPSVSLHSAPPPPPITSLKSRLAFFHTGKGRGTFLCCLLINASLEALPTKRVFIESKQMICDKKPDLQQTFSNIQVWRWRRRHTTEAFFTGYLC